MHEQITDIRNFSLLIIIIKTLHCKKDIFEETKSMSMIFFINLKYKLKMQYLICLNNNPPLFVNISAHT